MSVSTVSPEYKWVIIQPSVGLFQRVQDIYHFWALSLKLWLDMFTENHLFQPEEKRPYIRGSQKDDSENQDIDSEL